MRNGTRAEHPSPFRWQWLWTPAMVLVLAVSPSPARAQQFNSDNWWLLPYGTLMGILNVGQNYSSMYLGYGFAPGFEIDISPILFNEGRDNSSKHYATSGYVKGLIFENEIQTSGLAVMAGVGSTPAYYQSGAVTNDFKSYWAYAPLTLSFFDNAISWDIMPGVTYNLEFGNTKKSAWGFLYSSRMAVYKIIPMSCIVGEVYGAAGKAYSDPQYKVGVRFESKYVIAALTWGALFNGGTGGGVEFGIMILTDRFLCIGGCEEQPSMPAQSAMSTTTVAAGSSTQQRRLVQRNH